MPTSDDNDFVDLDDYVDNISDPAVDEVVGRMWNEIHLHRMGLASVREAIGFTQTDLAASLGVTQSNVAQTERRKDLLVSTLARYLGAIGADLHLVVRFEGRPPVELTLDELSEA
jgi:DNA-binding XRE family transcriptional regulator